VDKNPAFSSSPMAEKNERFVHRLGSGVVLLQKLRQLAAILEDSQQENKGGCGVRGGACVAFMGGRRQI
jgi:hypothetical protein